MSDRKRAYWQLADVTPDEHETLLVALQVIANGNWSQPLSEESAVRMQEIAQAALEQNGVSAPKVGVEADHREARQREGVNEPAPQPSPTSTPSTVLASGGARTPAGVALSPSDQRALERPEAGAETLRWGALPDGEDST